VVITDANGNEVGRGVADANGNYSIMTSVLPDGEQTLTVRSTDVLGQSASSSLQLTVDTALVLDVDISDNNITDTDNVINHAEQYNALITGEIEPGAAIDTMTIEDTNGQTLSIDSSTITVDANGHYSVNVDVSGLAEGMLSVAVIGTDIAGNTALAGKTILKDTICPITIDLAPSSDTGESDADNLTYDDTPLLQGETDPNAIVTVYQNGAAIGTTTADTDGKWSFEVPSLIDRPVTTKVEDSADSNGNELNNTIQNAVVFERSDFGAFVENFGGPDDTNGREIPQNVKDPNTLSARFIGAINNVDPDGNDFPTDGHVDQDWVKVSLKAGEKLILDVDYGANGNIWRNDGSVDTEIQIFDANGNLIDNVDEHIYNYPEGLVTEARQDDDLAPLDGGEGSVLYDRTGADARTLDPYYEFTVPEDGDYYIQVSAFNNGNRYDSGTYELWMSIENPKFDFSATAVDPYGNSGSTNALTVTLDTTAPAIAIASISDDSGESGDFITNDNTLVFNGTAEPGSQVDLYLDDQKVGTVTADSDGMWQYDYTQTILVDGNHTLKAVATDEAGNSREVVQTLIIDATAVADTPNLSIHTNEFSLGMNLEGLTPNSWSGSIDVKDIDGESGVSGTEWSTDNANTYVEVGQENVYLQNGQNDNYVIELEAKNGDASNLYTTVSDAKEGELYHMEFDYSPRKGHLNDSDIDIYFDGKLVKTLSGKGFDNDHLAMQHYTIDLYVESDGDKKLEFVAKDQNSLGGLLDNVQFDLQTNTGVAGHEIRLPEIDASLNDTDGSEQLRVEVEGLPVGSTLSDGNGHSFTATDHHTTADITEWQLDSIFYKTEDPGVDTLTVKVTSEEIVNGAVVDSAFTTETIDVTVLDPYSTATNLDDTLYFQSGDKVDGLAGTDTLILHQDESIDFSNLPAGTKVENIEKLDLTVNGNHDIKDLTLDDVIEMTDDDNTLVIEGDSADSVDVPDAPAGYSVTQTSEGGYDVFTYTGSSGDPTVTLKIDQDVPHS
ncbi:Ig-like domain-containing protein, partial [Hydrogenimonas sp.]|uniref:Ig-like domain-containing protein n=1 Tax=Hydrogenimonas sp. TaxID=2231112 RepID=UPI00262350D5